MQKYYRNTWFEFYIDKLNHLKDVFYNTDSIDEKLLDNIEKRANDLIVCCKVERAKRFPEKESN